MLATFLRLALLSYALQISVAAVSTVHASSELLKQCINSNQPEEDVTNWEHVMSDRMSAVKIAEAWWSSKPPEVPMTIITQLSLDRLGQLAAQVSTGCG